MADFVCEQMTHSFMLDRKSRGLSGRTINFYSKELRYFCEYLDTIGATYLEEKTPDILRAYFLELSRRGRNRGGIHAGFRAIRAFLKWTWDEYEIDQRNPIDKVRVPAGSSQPIPGLSMEEFKKILATCTTERDRAILLTLVDTGVRRSELTKISLQDVDLNLGVVKVIGGKGGKDRYVFIGQTTRRAIKKYLRSRSNLQPGAPLFSTFEETRLTPSGLRQITRRRAEDAGISPPGLHQFRRLAAISLLRNGCDLVSLSRLLGHSSLSVTQRYLYQLGDDLQAAHRKSSPIDNMGAR